LLQAFLSSCLAVLLTLSCALLTHVAMKHCRRVADRKGAGLAGFLRFFLLATITCLGWAVAWSNWELVLSLMDALEPGRSSHHSNSVRAVIVLCLVLSACFYLRFGPEPIIPDPKLQHVCYSHGYSSSLRRSLVSYVVYSCVICMVMACCDPTYGLLISLASAVLPSISSLFDLQALLVLCSMACVVTVVGALCSAAITWAFEVDAASSMRLSRSVNNACNKMVVRRRSRFEAMLSEVQKAGSDACFIEVGDQNSPERLPIEETDDEPEDFAGSSICTYSRLPLSDEDAFSEVESERQLQLNPGAITNALCVSVLLYDVLGFVVCFQWGAIAVRGFSLIFGHLARKHWLLYACSCGLYALVVTAVLTRMCLVFFPSSEECSQAEATPDPVKDLSPSLLREETPREQPFGPRRWWQRSIFPSGSFDLQALLRPKPRERDLTCQELCETLNQPS